MYEGPTPQDLKEQKEHAKEQYMLDLQNVNALISFFDDNPDIWFSNRSLNSASSFGTSKDNSKSLRGIARIRIRKELYELKCDLEKNLKDLL
jgi:hypothetical protein